MTSVIALLVIVMVSLIGVRVGGTALMLTGLSAETASFQAYSAFFGVGFTTHEAELVVNHPVRRRIIRDLIVAGNIGLTSVVATLVVTLLQSTSRHDTAALLGWLLGGLVLMFMVARVGWVQRLTDRLISHTLQRAGLVRALDYELLLRIQHGYVVSEVEVLPGTRLAERTLGESRPWDDGVVILAITRDNEVGPDLPGPATLIKAGDVVTAYGKEAALRALTHPLNE